MIIHICGPSASGKTFLGKKLSEKFGDRIIVKDFDELRNNFYHNNNKKWDDKKFQNFLDNFIISHKNKNLIFVGLNCIPMFNFNYYFDLHSDYKYYIDIDIDELYKQSCKRHNPANPHIFNCNYKNIQKYCNLWNKEYKKQGYEFLPHDEIYNKVSELLSKKTDNLIPLLFLGLLFIIVFFAVYLYLNKKK